MSMSFSKNFSHVNRNLLESIFGNYLRDHQRFIECRLIKKDFVPTQRFYRSLSEVFSDTALDDLDAMNQQGWNIFFSVCPRVREHGKKEDVPHSTTLWADLDAKDYVGGKEEAWERLMKFEIAPSAIVDSGHGYHAYWFLSEIVDVTDPKQFEGCVKGIARKLGADSVHDVSRVLRLPGFINMKEPSNPVPCVLLEEFFFPERQYTLQDFMHLWVQSDDKSRVVTLNNAPKEVPPRFLALLKADAKLAATWNGTRKLPNDNSRSGYDMSLAQQLKQHGFTDGEAASILMQSPSGKGKDATPQYLAHTIGKAKNMPTERIAETELMDMLEPISKDFPKYKLPNALDNFFQTLAHESTANIFSILRHAVKNKFGLTNEDTDAYEKTVLQYKKQLAIDTQNEEDEVIEVFTNDETAQGKEFLQSPVLLYDALCMLKRSGLVGEERNALIHYLAFTSRLLGQPISITVKGESSAGKSFTLGKAMELMPKSAYIDLTDATPQSFYYGKPDQFKHRIIVIFEKNGAERTDYTIRSLQSEGKLKIQVTVKNPETGAFEAKTIEREGPTGFITTTTSSQIHAENETRNLSIFPDQTTFQTERIYNATNERYLGKNKLSENEVRPFQAAQALIKGYPVLIPYVDGLGKYFPKEILRTRRDYPRFLSVIEVSTLLHQDQREKIEKNGTTYLRATLADYEIARCLTEESLARSIYELPPKTLELLEKIPALIKQLLATRGYSDTDTKDDWLSFTITDLALYMKWNRDTVGKWLEPALKKTIVTLVDKAKGRLGARYILEDTPYHFGNLLPSIDIVASQNPDEPLDGIYNPLTGETINVKTVDTVADQELAKLAPEVKDHVTDTQTNAVPEQSPSSNIPF